MLSWLLYILPILTVLPTNMSTIDMMIDVRLPVFLWFVFLLIFVCFGVREEAPIITQNHCLGWGVNPRRMPHPEMPYLAWNHRQHHAGWHRKRRKCSEPSWELSSSMRWWLSLERKIGANLSMPVTRVAVDRRKLRNLTPRQAWAIVWCLSLMVGVGGVGSWTILWAAIGFRQWIGGGEADFWREKNLRAQWERVNI